MYMKDEWKTCHFIAKTVTLKKGNIKLSRHIDLFMVEEEEAHHMMIPVEFLIFMMVGWCLTSAWSTVLSAFLS